MKKPADRWGKAMLKYKLRSLDNLTTIHIQRCAISFANDRRAILGKKQLPSILYWWTGVPIDGD